MGEESWERNHEMEAPRRHPAGTQGAPRRHPRGSQKGSQEAPRTPRRFPEGSQEAPRRHPGGSQGNQVSTRPLREGRAILY